LNYIVSLLGYLQTIFSQQTSNCAHLF